MPELVPGLILLKELGFSFGIVTNQSVIGRGIGTRKQVESVNTRLCELLEAHGLSFTFILVCPHSPSDLCGCRKPAIGLGLTAIEKYDLDPEMSFMIGDKISDVIFGHALGCRSIHICQDMRINTEADFTASDVLSAAMWISKN